ncbi:hypothetical protein TTRE_0000515801 [Trichuris trichiura]|uniref:Uncharacterized protein n=1 Tax=Trichuris trichiura TaxID=36087 RepID=A0A077ZDY4_TRITR|nr:hypothetical protein TTRE_0000515801 [Trichuris trichiura]
MSGKEKPKEKKEPKIKFTVEEVEVKTDEGDRPPFRRLRSADDYFQWKGKTKPPSRLAPPKLDSKQEECLEIPRRKMLDKKDDRAAGSKSSSDERGKDKEENNENKK